MSEALTPSELRTKACVELEKEILAELEVEDPEEKVVAKLLEKKDASTDRDDGTRSS